MNCQKRVRVLKDNLTGLNVTWQNSTAFNWFQEPPLPGVLQSALKHFAVLRKIHVTEFLF